MVEEVTLALDVGSNSLGWALVSEGNKILEAGVRVFPEGVERNQSGGEVSKNQARRMARGARRLVARRRLRKWHLRRVLVEAGLLPATCLHGRNSPERVAWEREQFVANDPYTLRAEALERPLALHELGRVLIHLNQRRGFKSNRKVDRARKEEDSALLQEISALQAEMGERTLGQYLSSLRGDDPHAFHRTRIRGKHTRREMYEAEFNAIWDFQAQYHPEVLTSELRAKVHHILFYQRPLRSPSASLIGACELEPRLPRCPRADRRAQKFRLFQEVNNLRVIDTGAGCERPLSPQERQTLIDFLFSAKERTFDAIRKKLFPHHDNIRFNLERGERTKLLGMQVDAVLSKRDVLGKAWKQVPETRKDQVVAAIVDDDEPRLKFLLQDAGLDPQTTERLLEATPLETGYCSYSLHAIKKLLPHLERGLPLSSRDPHVPCALREAGYQMPWERPSAENVPYLPEPPVLTNPLVRSALYEVRKVVNAILREYIHKPGRRLARIHLELAREVKGSAMQRRRQSLEMRRREKQRAAAARAIEEFSLQPTRDRIDRYLLWQEQGGVCVYSGKNISVQQLFGGEIDIDHILPYSRSLDNSFLNKVVCFRSENNRGVNPKAKGAYTPYEWLAASDPEKYEQVLQRAKKLPYPKLRRFYQQSVELDDFINRQLVDTAYIATQVHDFLRKICDDVVCVKGQHTAELRRRWGLDTVLGELPNCPAWREAQELPPGQKNRLDHRHHAIDAIVIALTDRKRLYQLAQASRGRDAKLDEPWPNFRREVAAVIERINVSHRVRRKVSGQLHDATIYAPTNTPDRYVYRKFLEQLSLAEVPHIRDPRIRQLVEDRLRQHGLEPGRGKGAIPAEVWNKPLMMPARDARSSTVIRRVRLLKPSKSLVPIRGGTAYVEPGNTHHLCLFELDASDGQKKRVAVFVSMLEAANRLREQQRLIKEVAKQLRARGLRGRALREQLARERRRILTEVAPLVRRQHPDHPEAHFLMSLSNNELVLLEHEGKFELYRLQTSASTSQQMWFRHHAACGKTSDKIGKVSKKPSTFQGRKVTVDPLGRIRWARD